jgi:hypothetical protein
MSTSPVATKRTAVKKSAPKAVKTEVTLPTPVVEQPVSEPSVDENVDEELESVATMTATPSIDEEIKKKKRELAAAERKEHFPAARFTGKLISQGINREVYEKVESVETDGKLYKSCLRWRNRDNATASKKKIVNPFRIVVSQKESTKRAGKTVQDVQKENLTEKEIDEVLASEKHKSAYEHRSLYSEAKVRFSAEAGHFASKWFETLIRQAATYAATRTRDAKRTVIHASVLLDQNAQNDPSAAAFIYAFNRSQAFNHARVVELQSMIDSVSKKSFERGQKAKKEKDPNAVKLTPEERKKATEEKRKADLVKKIANLQLELDGKKVPKCIEPVVVEKKPTHPFTTGVKELTKLASADILPAVKISSDYKELLCAILDEFVDRIHTAVSVMEGKTILLSSIVPVIRSFYPVPTCTSEIAQIEEIDPEELERHLEAVKKNNELRAEAEKAGKPLPAKYETKKKDLNKVLVDKFVVHSACPSYDAVYEAYALEAAARENAKQIAAAAKK